MLKFSLKKKITITTILAGLFLAVLLSLVIFWYLNKNLTNQKVDEILKLNIEQVHESTQIIKKDQIFAKMLGTRTRVREFLLNKTEARKKELLGIFSDYAKEDTKYLAIYLLDKNGIGLISTDSRFVGQNYSFRNYFIKALAGTPTIDVSIGKTSNQFGYYFSYPVQDSDGSVLGVLVVKIDNQEIDKAILDSEISKNSTTMLVDQYGIVLVSNRRERFLKSLGNISNENKKIIKETDRLLGQEIESLQYENAQNIVNNYKGVEVTRFFDATDGEMESISVVKLDGFPFYLVTEIGLESVQDVIFLTISIIILIIMLGILLFFFLIYKFLVAFINPIKKFTLLSESISKGDFSKKIDIKTEDEFGKLATVFNKMTDNLSDLYKNLDKKVQDKTQEIEVKAKQVEDQKSAILNILEDVEKEKSNVENLANDLEKFKLAVDNASDQVVITDPEGIVIYGNRAVERITGYKPEEAIGRKAGTLWKTPMPLTYYQQLWDTIKNKKEVFVSEIKNQRKNGEFYIANVSISPVLDAENNVLYFVAIEHDITKEKEIDKAKTEFVSLASHQLRTPLSAINWYTEMLLAGDAGKINEEQKKYLNEIAIGNHRMVELVDALLNVSRLDLGTFIIEPESTNIIEMAQSVVRELKPQIIEKKLKVEETYGENIGEFQADKKLLRIVFQNLLSNAVKYTPSEGSVKVELSIKPKGEKIEEKEITDDIILIKISDSGIGIPINQQDKIFSKLFRADNARESETEGTGLGLYIIKSIIDQSGGEIWFKSEEGKGTAFYITFSLSGMNKKEGTKKLD